MQSSDAIAEADGRRQSTQDKQKKKQVEYCLFVRVYYYWVQIRQQQQLRRAHRTVWFLFWLIFLSLGWILVTRFRRAHQPKEKIASAYVGGKAIWHTYEGSHQQMLAIFRNHPRDTCVGFGWREVGASTCLKCRGESGKALDEMTEHASIEIMHSEIFFSSARRNFEGWFLAATTGKITHIKSIAWNMRRIMSPMECWIATN